MIRCSPMNRNLATVVRKKPFNKKSPLEDAQGVAAKSLC